MLNTTRNAKLRKAILEYADAELISALCECAHNIPRGTIRLTSKEKVRLRKYTSDLRAIVNRKTIVNGSRRILQQKGGFLPALLAPLTTIHVSTFVASIIREDDAREEDGVGRPSPVGNIAYSNAATS